MAIMKSRARKREFSGKERSNLADKGATMPDGSYPIKNTVDIKNAVKAIGCAKNPGAVKRHISRRARALGCTDLLPEDWSGSTKRAEEDAPAKPTKLTAEVVVKRWTEGESFGTSFTEAVGTALDDHHNSDVVDGMEPALKALDTSLRSIMGDAELESDARKGMMQTSAKDFIKAVRKEWPEAEPTILEVATAEVTEKGAYDGAGEGADETDEESDFSKRLSALKLRKARLERKLSTIH